MFFSNFRGGAAQSHPEWYEGSDGEQSAVVPRHLSQRGSYRKGSMSRHGGARVEGRRGEEGLGGMSEGGIGSDHPLSPVVPNVWADMVSFPPVYVHGRQMVCSFCDICN